MQEAVIMNIEKQTNKKYNLLITFVIFPLFSFFIEFFEP